MTRTAQRTARLFSLAWSWLDSWSDVHGRTAEAGRVHWARLVPFLFLHLGCLGEGWHNNHHRYPASTRQGFTCWEIDVTYCVLKFLSWIGLIWKMQQVPAHVMAQRAKRPRD